MKKIFTLFCCFTALYTKAQVLYNNITFDDSTYKNCVFIDTTHYHHNIWQVGKPQKPVFDAAYSAPNALITDTVTPYPPNDTSVFIVKIPAWSTFSSSIYPLYIFDFEYRMDIDSGTIVKIEVSGDSVINWVNIDSCSSSTAILPENFYCPLYWYNDTFDTTGWIDFSIDRDILFSPLRGLTDTVLFRFTFISDSVTSNRDGWMIDNMFMEYFATGLNNITQDNTLSIYPNPCAGKLYLSTNLPATKNTVSVYDMQGKEVYETNNVLPQAYIDLPLPNGVYVLQYHDADYDVEKQLIIQRQ